MKGRKKGNILLYWIPALLLLLPAVYVIVLLESTVDNESMALKNKIRESYKSSLIDTSKKLSEYWKLLENEKTYETNDPLEIITATGADSAIIYDHFGKMVFPIVDTGMKFSPVPKRFLSAREKAERRDYINAINDLLFIAANNTDIREEGIALYEAAVLMEKIGKHEEALEICNKLIYQEIYKDVKNFNANLIYLDAMALLLDIEPYAKDNNSQILNRLNSLLNDYSRTDILTSQRLNLSFKVQKQYELPFPLQKAESTALELLKKSKNQDRRNILQKTLLKDMWQYTVNGRYVLLFSGEKLNNTLLSLVSDRGNIPEKTNLGFLLPGQEENDSIVHLDAASRMPGWRISLNFNDPGYMASLIQQRVKVYRYTSVIVVSFSLVLGVLFLRDMRRKLHLADLKNDLVANVTHELKTPLASSRLLLDTLITQPDLPREKIESYLTHLSKENSRLCRLVEHFLAFSKLEKNQYNFQIKTICLDDLIDDLNEAIQGRFPAQKHRIAYECTEEEVFIKGDTQSLVTVIVNLLENALKFSENEQKVYLKILSDGSRLKVSVRDEGIGISDKEQKKIFEQYYQADNRLSRQYEGSGLGLNIVKTVLEAHKSKIYITSSPGNGSCFSFELSIEKEVDNETVHSNS